MIGSLLQDRYAIESELGRGGMGTVYRAEDTLLERPVAVKVVSATGLGTEGRSRLLQEARAAARLNHPNIVAVYDAGTVDLPNQKEPASFIVMELVKGQTLRDTAYQDLDEIVEIAKAICLALTDAHQQGIIHRDLKPENVSVTVTGTVKLMDFGLARISGKTRLTQHGALMGTLSYLAPEIISGQEASPSSDLYALGVMLYEMSAGRPPFEGSDLTAVISQHLYAPVVPPGAYNDKIPPAMDQLIVQLLNKQPEDRPESAEAVRASLEDIFVVAPSPKSPAPIPELNRLVRGRMIGREEEFAQAVAPWQQAASAQGQFLLISGEPGIGKTRMVRELSTYAEISGGKVLTGLCYAEERTPYGPIGQLVRSSLDNGLNLDLPQPVLADLLALAPELRLKYADVAHNERLEPEADQQRLFESLATWFEAMTVDNQMLFVVEDVHWADSGSLSMLRHLAQRVNRRRALLLATYREVELDEALPFQDMLNELSLNQITTRIKLTRLSKEQTRDLLATLFVEEITPELLDGIYRETEGNPFFVEEVCKSLVDSGELFYEDGRWHRPDIEELQIPQGIRVTIQSRLGKLTKVEQNTLQLAALLGRNFEYEMLSVVCELGEDNLIDVLEKGEQAQLIEEVGRPGPGKTTEFTFTHALIHSTLLSNLSTLRRQRQGKKVAMALESSFPERQKELAPLMGRYFAEAGDGLRAVEYLLLAGDEARQVYAYDEAITAYEQALLFLRELEDYPRAARTLMKLGLTYHNIFAFDKSRQAYDEGFAAWQRATDSEISAADSLPEASHAYRVSVTDDPLTMDPSCVTDGGSSFIVHLLFSGLLELAAGDELVPDVAQSWDMSEDGTRYVFYLRKDVFWNDGTRVTAGDFEFSWMRALGPENQDLVAKVFYDIKGAQAYHCGEVDDPDSVGVKAVDEHTLVVHLESPCSYFLQLMALSVTKPLPRKVVDRFGPEWARPDNIVTNGPFQVRTWLPDERLVFERHPGYHGHFKGNISEFVRTVAPAKSFLERYESDAVDVVNPYFPSMEAGHRAIQLHPDEYHSRPGAGTVYVSFNVSKPPFDDPRVRHALALAMDRESVVSRASRGTRFPATGGFVPPGIPGHVPGIATPCDPDLAREKLVEAGYPGGDGFPVINLLVSDGHNIGNMFGVFCEHWEEVLGVQIRPELVDFYTLLDLQVDNPPPMWVMGWYATYPDPDNFLRASVWLSSGKWRHQAYEALVNDARRTADQGQRMVMYRQAERILLEEAPIIPVSYYQSQVLVKPWIRTLPMSIINGAIMKDVIIDPH
jgi:ABC-type oligopeptide transport system substrate-binding subunit/serine/threonine protein kinase